MRIAHIVLRLGLGILVVVPAGATFAQSQSSPDPLAAAAKRAQSDKKDQAKPARVWDNDTIPKAGTAISVVGQNEAPANDGTAPGVTVAAVDAGTGTADAKATPAGSTQQQAPAPADTANIQSQLNNAKENLASLKVDLDLMQRTLVLDSQMYYSKPDYSTDRAGARKLTDEQAKIADKQQAIEESEKQIADLEAQLKDSPQNSNPPASRN